METSVPPDDGTVYSRFAESIDARGPVASDSSQDASVLANPGKSTCAATQSESETNLHMGRSGQADESVTGQTSPGTGRPRNVARLGTETIEEPDALRVAEQADLNLSSLRPSELTRLLNSTPLGPVICDRQLYRHRMRAGYQLGQKRRIDFVKYVAWLFTQRHSVVEEQEVARTQTISYGGEGMTVRPIALQEVIKLVRSQDYRCALTGRELIPQTASLDHIVPVSRGGEHCIANAQVLHEAVNRAKGTLTNEEFIQICREVVAHVDQGRSQITTERYVA